ncbi:phosphate ABC transporter ATP-binding protein [Stappia sp.]|uniref:ABC transporter ATP-binding protein n=1 Tax=Stappia sp. TaxID=1870903 RepID=UPI003C7C2D04
MPDACLKTIDGGYATPASAPAPLLMQARGVSFRPQGKPLVDDIDLDIREGRRLIVMGSNGAGKSLLMRLLHGLIAPTSGEVVWRGKPLDRTAMREQAMVFQRPVMLRRSVIANLQFALAVRGIGGAERRRRVEEALEQARLGDLAKRPARVLSGGEQQRLALARALACTPRLLFLDEPTASLDPASTLAIENLIATAHARGITIVMITHDKGQARRLGDDIAFLHAGRLVETGPAARVLETPSSGAARAWLEGRLYLDDLSSPQTSPTP